MQSGSEWTSVGLRANLTGAESKPYGAVSEVNLQGLRVNLTGAESEPYGG